jgi:hypothetical protein
MFGIASPALRPPRPASVQYFAIAHDTSPFVSIYKRVGDVLTKLDNPTSLPAGSGSGCAFSRDGQFLAIAHSTTPFVTIYQRNGDTFIKLADPATLPTGNAGGAAWSADGQFLAIAHDISPWVTIYQRSDTTFTKLANPASLPPDTGRGCAFSADGTLFAVAHSTTPFISIYTISGTTFTKQANPATLPGATQPGMGCAFSPEGAYLAVASGSQAQSHTIYAISAGPVFTKITNPTMPSDAFDASWSDDSKVLVCGLPYDRVGATFTNRVRGAGVGITSRLGDDISPDGTYIGVAGFPTSFMAFYKKFGSTIQLLGNPSVIPTGTGRGASWSPRIEFSEVANPLWLNRAFSKGSSSVSATIPSGNTGDILVAAVYYDVGVNIINLYGLTGWQQHYGQKTQVSQNVGLAILSRVATGSDALTIGGTGTMAWAACVLRFPAGGVNYHLMPCDENGGTGTSADPIAVAVSEVLPYLYLAFCGAGSNSTTAQDITGYPAGWANAANSYSGASAGTATIGVAEQPSTALTQDPGPFTIAASRLYRTQTVALGRIPASGAAPVFIASGTMAKGFTDVTIPMPAGILVGDLLIGQIGKNIDAPSTVNTATSGTGWTLLPHQVYGGGGTHEYYYKIATGSDASLRLTTTQWTIGQVHCIRGASIERMSVAAFAQTTGTTTPACPANTPISGNRDYLALAGFHCGTTSVDTTGRPAGYSNHNTPLINVDIGTLFSSWKTATAATFAAATYTFAGNVNGRLAHILFWGAYIPPPARFWRIMFPAWAAYIGTTEIEFRSTASASTAITEPATGGVAIGNFWYNRGGENLEPANAFNGSFTGTPSRWSTDTVYGTQNFYVGYDFGVGVKKSVAQLAIAGSGSGQDFNLYTGVALLQQSNDGITWTTVKALPSFGTFASSSAFNLYAVP